MTVNLHAKSIELAFRCDQTLGFLGAVGTLKIVATAVPGATLHWRKGDHRHAVLTGCDRDSLVALVLAYAVSREFDPAPTTKHDGKREPWDLCGAGRVQLQTEIPKILATFNQSKAEETLFGPWRWSDAGTSLGWVPTMMEHALRARAPTKDKKTRVDGAVWLAWEGIEVFGVLDGKPVGWTRQPGRPWALVWPQWCSPATVQVVRSLILAGSSASRIGAHEVWQARRVKASGKNFELTAPAPLPVR